MDDMFTRLCDEHGRARHALEELLQERDARPEGERRFTSEEQEKFGKIDADLNDLDARVKQWGDRLEGDAKIDAMRSRIEKLDHPSTPILTMADDQDQRALDFFQGKGGNTLDVSLRGLHVERDGRSGRNVVREAVESRAGLTSNTAGAGSEVIPVSFRAVLYQHLIQHSAIRQTRATVLTTSSGEALLLPKTTAHPTAGTIISQAAAIGEADPTFGQGTLNAYKYANLVQVSAELETDTGVDLLGYLAKIMGQRLADGCGKDFITGAGTTGPEGVVVGAGTICKVSGGTGQSGIPTYKELESMYDSVIPAYQNNGEWLLSQSTISKLRQITDGNSRPLFYSGLEGFAGAPPNTIFGKPFYLDVYMPTAGTAGTSILFGDFASYFIRDVDGIRFERSVDYAFNTDLLTYRAILRTDGRLLDKTGAIGCYVGGAT